MGENNEAFGAGGGQVFRRRKIMQYVPRKQVNDRFMPDGTANTVQPGS